MNSILKNTDAAICGEKSAQPDYGGEREMARKALKTALLRGADQARITLNAGTQSSFSVLNGRLDKLQSATDRSLFIQLFVDGRYGAYSTNRLEENELDRFIRQAVQITRFVAPDPYRMLPDPALYFRGPGEDLKQFDPRWSGLDPEVKKQTAFRVYDEMAGKDSRILSASAEYGDSLDYLYTVDSQDFEGSSLQSSFSIGAECSVKGDSDARPEGWWFDGAMFLDRFRPEGCGSRALSRALGKLGGRKIAGGKYTLVVENTCSSRLLGPVLNALSGAALQQQRSFLKESLGKKCFPDRMTLTDQPHLPGSWGARYFDSEGIATRPRNIIDRGIVGSYFLNTYYAGKLNTAPTVDGPSVPGFSQDPFDPSDRNLDAESILRRADKGIFVTGFNGGNCNEATGDFSFGVEGFYFDRGTIEYPVREMNITGNMLSLWNHLLWAGNDPRECSRWRIPTLAFEAVDFSGI